MPKSKKTRTYEEQDGGINFNNIKSLGNNLRARLPQALSRSPSPSSPPRQSLKDRFSSLSQNLQSRLPQALSRSPSPSPSSPRQSLKDRFSSLSQNLQSRLPQLPSRSPSPSSPRQSLKDRFSSLSQNLQSRLPQTLSRSPSPEPQQSLNLSIPNQSMNIPDISQAAAVTPLTDISNTSATFPAAQAAVDTAELPKLEQEIAQIAQQQTGGASLTEIEQLRTNAEKLLRQTDRDTEGDKYKEIQEDLKMIATLEEISKQEPTHHTLSEIRSKLTNILTHATERGDTSLINTVKNDLDKLKELEEKQASKNLPTTPAMNSTRCPVDADASKIARVFPCLTLALGFVITEFKKPSVGTSLFTVISLLLILSSMFLSITYLIILLKESSESQLIANPLNLQAPEYNISKSVQFFGSEYKYQLFIILPVLAICFSGYALYRSKKQDTNHSDLVTGIIIVCLIQAVIALILNVSTYSYAYKKLKMVNGRINDLNNYIHNKIYKNATFLSHLKEIPHDSLSVSAVVKKTLATIESQPSVDVIANAFFTLNLYYHFQKIGFRNEHISNAMNIFDIHSLFVGSSLKDRINIMNKISQAQWSPTDFLFRKTTFIEDHSQAMKKVYLKMFNGSVSSHTVDNAVNKVSIWLAELNGRANMINPQDSWKGFITMAILILVIQTAPLLLVIHFYKKSTST